MDAIEHISLAEVAASFDQESAWLYALYLRGDRDEAEDELWLRAAAEMGIVPAMHTYAEFLEDERGDLAKANEWYAAAAEGGSAPALYEMGLIHDERHELAEGEACYRRAAERGLRSPMYDLGCILATRGDPEAHVWLAVCRESGYEPWDVQ
jgi:TPR repeat protein